jgi:hypothetical protein
MDGSRKSVYGKTQTEVRQKLMEVKEHGAVITKKRAIGEGTIGQRKNGLWYGQLTVGYDPDMGKRIRKSVYSRSRFEAHQKLREIRRCHDA